MPRWEKIRGICKPCRDLLCRDDPFDCNASATDTHWTCQSCLDSGNHQACEFPIRPSKAEKQAFEQFAAVHGVDARTSTGGHLAQARRQSEQVSQAPSEEPSVGPAPRQKEAPWPSQHSEGEVAMAKPSFADLNWTAAQNRPPTPPLSPEFADPLAITPHLDDIVRPNPRKRSNGGDTTEPSQQPSSARNEPKDDESHITKPAVEDTPRKRRRLVQGLRERRSQASEDVVMLEASPPELAISTTAANVQEKPVSAEPSPKTKVSHAPETAPILLVKRQSLDHKYASTDSLLQKFNSAAKRRRSKEDPQEDNAGETLDDQRLAAPVQKPPRKRSDNDGLTQAESSSRLAADSQKTLNELLKTFGTHSSSSDPRKEAEKTPAEAPADVNRSPKHMPPARRKSQESSTKKQSMQANSQEVQAEVTTGKSDTSIERRELHIHSPPNHTKTSLLLPCQTPSQPFTQPLPSPRILSVTEKLSQTNLHSVTNKKQNMSTPPGSSQLEDKKSVAPTQENQVQEAVHDNKSSVRPAQERNYADEYVSLMQQAAKRRQSMPQDAGHGPVVPTAVPSTQPHKSSSNELPKASSSENAETIVPPTAAGSSTKTPVTEPPPAAEPSNNERATEPQASRSVSLGKRPLESDTVQKSSSQTGMLSSQGSGYQFFSTPVTGRSRKSLPDVKVAGKSASGPSTSLAAGPSAGAVALAVTNPVTDPVTGPSAGLVTDPVAGAVAGPVASPSADPSSGRSSEKAKKRTKVTPDSPNQKIERAAEKRSTEQLNLLLRQPMDQQEPQQQRQSQQQNQPVVQQQQHQPAQQQQQQQQSPREEHFQQLQRTSRRLEAQYPHLARTLPRAYHQLSRQQQSVHFEYYRNEYIRFEAQNLTNPNQPSGFSEHRALAPYIPGDSRQSAQRAIVTPAQLHEQLYPPPQDRFPQQGNSFVAPTGGHYSTHRFPSEPSPLSLASPPPAQPPLPRQQSGQYSPTESLLTVGQQAHTPDLDRYIANTRLRVCIEPSQESHYIRFQSANLTTIDFIRAVFESKNILADVSPFTFQPTTDNPSAVFNLVEHMETAASMNSNECELVRASRLRLTFSWMPLLQRGRVVALELTGNSQATDQDRIGNVYATLRERFNEVVLYRQQQGAPAVQPEPETVDVDIITKKV